MGYDVVGEIDQLGDGVSGLQVGDRVADMTVVGSNAAYRTLRADRLARVPAGLDAAEAAALILSWTTAYQLLHRAARVQPGQRVLVQGAAGALGQALLVLGRMAGLELWMETHLNIYCQPGKHAFLPSGEWFQLLPDWKSCCNDSAGSGGVLLNELFAGCLPGNKDTDTAVGQYIKSHFSFVPTLCFTPVLPENHLYMSWESLCGLIPGHLTTQLDKILEWRRRYVL
jgi:hypothetical protein